MSVFKVSFKPKYHSPKVNYQAANLKNIFKSFFVGKFRYLKRLVTYKKITKQMTKVKTPQDLAQLTALSRPGPLYSQDLALFFRRLGVAEPQGVNDETKAYRIKYDGVTH